MKGMEMKRELDPLNVRNKKEKIQVTSTILSPLYEST